jgi:bacteriorhodopsin
METVKYDGVHLAGALAMVSGAIYVLGRYGIDHPVESVILGVAFVAYLILTISPKRYWMFIRFIDWFVTVPLLLYTVSTFGTVNYAVLAGLSVGMIAAGFLAILGSKKNYTLFNNIGFIFYFGVILALALSNNTLPPWIYVFFGSWLIYGFVDRIEGPRDHWAYTALDVFNKPVFIFFLLNEIA